MNCRVSVVLFTCRMPYRVAEVSVVDRVALVKLGAVVRRARVAHRWSQFELEQRTRVDQSSISRFERGGFPGLRIAWFVRMATALSLDIDGLAPRDRFVVDGVLEAFRIARLEADGRICLVCRRPL